MLIRRIQQLLDAGEQGALAIVVRTAGSAPQRPGARLLLLEDGERVGTVGGGAIEREVLAALASCLEDGRPRWVVRDLGRDLGMCCGGRMEVFVERIEAEERLILFGAGHVAQATARAARQVGFSVCVVDARDELNTEARFEGCERILADAVEAVHTLKPTSRDWVVVVTHDHALDEEALETYLPLPHRYLGMIGSLRKVYRVLGRIAARGELPPLENLYAPIGLDLGAVSPEEIAVSVVAELVALRHGKPAAHLRAMDSPRLAKVLAGGLSPEAAASLAETADAAADSAIDI
ncbi:MAG: XdhC family protein [Deltaproteobacteria bacterium]|nr:XdhC family protein [Deltaproteobacteria bacterium]